MSAERFLHAQIGTTSLRLEYKGEYLEEFYLELNQVLETDCGSKETYETNLDEIKEELVREVDKVDDISELCRKYRQEKGLREEVIK